MLTPRLLTWTANAIRRQVAADCWHRIHTSREDFGSYMAASYQLRAPANALDHIILPTVVLGSLPLAIGLTYAPCYSALCVETYFPIQARGQIGAFYGISLGIGCALWARVQFRAVRQFLEWQPEVFDKLVIVTGKRISIGGLSLAVWIAGVSFATIGL